jgi:hypothetical protein
MVTRLARDDLLALRTAQRSLDLLDMLYTKTLGNLDETERDALLSARSDIRRRMPPASGDEGPN